MKTPDGNVLVAAYRADHAHHAVARRWLLDELSAAATGQRLALLPMVCTSFVWLVTHPRIFEVPAAAAEAIGFVEALLASPGCEMVPLGSEWAQFALLCGGKRLSANAVQDAWIAAAARTLGAKLATFDRDFTDLLHAHELELLSPAA